jgi:hypothetical protein
MSDSTLFPSDVPSSSVDPKEQLIQDLKKDNSELRTQLTELAETQKTLKSLMEQLASGSKPQSGQPETVPNIDELKQQLLQELRAQTGDVFAGMQTEQVHKANEASCMQAAKQKYGDAYAAKLIELGTELGLSQEQIVQRARSEPKAFFRLFGLEQSPSSTVTRPDGSPSTVAPVEKPKRLSSLSTTADLKAAWHAAGQKVAALNSITYDPALHKIAKKSFQ